MKTKLGFLLLFVSLPLTSAFSGGLDLNFNYGTRYIYLGGNQVSISKDAYAPFYNPAGMSGVEKPEVAVNISNLITQISAPIGGDNQQRKSQWNLGPLFYLGGVYPINDRLTFGFAVFPTNLQGAKYTPATFGTITGREQSDFLARIEFAPSIAFRVYENISLGLSYRIAYTRYNKEAGNTAYPGGLFLDESMSGWDADGLKIGSYLNNWNGLSAGITYRLQTQPSLAGSANVTNALGSLPTTVTQDPILPSNLQAGFSYEFIPDTVMMAFTYEWTQNSMLADISNVKGFGAFTGLGSDVVNGGVKARDDHEFHIGAEYTFHLAQHRKIRAGAGVCFDTAASRSDFPSAFLSPATFYKGYGLGGQYDTGSNVVGLAVNYGNNSKTSTTVDPTLAGSVFAGKYKLEEWLAVLDYQYRF